MDPKFPKPSLLQILLDGFLKSLLFILLILLIPILLLWSVLAILHGKTVEIFARRFRPDLGKKLAPRSCVFAAENIYEKPQRNIVVEVAFDRQFTVESTREIFQRRVLDLKDSRGRLQYPEFKQTLTSFAGYLFWENAKKFDIKEHIKAHQTDSAVISDEDLREIRNNLVVQKWTKGRPLWEFILVDVVRPQHEDEVSNNPDKPPSTTLVMFRFHHSLSDGYSMIGVLYRFIDENATPDIMNMYKNKPPERHPLWQALSIFYIFPQVIWDAAGCSYEFLKGHPLQGDNSGNMSVMVADSYSIQKIKHIKNHYGVLFSSVLYTVVGAALRELMLTKGDRLREFTNCMSIIPLPDHPTTLTNYMTVGMLKIPMSISDPISRLKYCDSLYRGLTTSSFPVFFKYALPLLGLFVTRVTEVTGRNYFSPVFMTNFPGVLSHDVEVNTLGKIVDTIFMIATQGGATGVVFSCTTVGDNFRLAVSAADNVMSKDELEDFSKSISSNFKLLYNLSSSESSSKID